MDCLDEKLVAEFLRGKLPRERMVAIGDHVTACPKCKDLVRTVAGRSFSSLGDLFDDEDTLRRQRPPEVGRVVGKRFTIVRLLGEGAMGVVYEAEDQLLDTKVALKFLKSSFTNNATFMGRVKREILIGRRISHPNVARVYDLWTTDDHNYIQMELLGGETLDAMLKRGPLEQATATSLLVQIASALEAAHKEGVVHRDLKPSNMMVDGSGKLTVTDFGLASDLRSDGNLSVGSGPIGTPAYWAPEQARCEAVTPASDIFSYGVIAHYLLLHEFPAVGTTLSNKIPSRLRPILEKCLEAQPARRYQNGAELMQALRHARVSSPRARGRLRRWLLASAAFVAGAVIAGLWARPGGGPEVPGPTRPAVALARDASALSPIVQPLPAPTPTPVAAGPDAAVALAVVEVKAPEPAAVKPVKGTKVAVAKPEARADAGIVEPPKPEPTPVVVPAPAPPPPEPPKPNAEALTALRERLGRLDGSLAARQITPEDVPNYPTALATARTALGAGKLEDAAESVAKAETLASAAKVDHAYIDGKVKRLGRLAKERPLAPEVKQKIEERFSDVGRAFGKRDFELANKHLLAIQQLLATSP